MSRRGWVGWIEEHRNAVAGLVMTLVFSVAGVGAVVASRNQPTAAAGGGTALAAGSGSQTSPSGGKGNGGSAKTGGKNGGGQHAENGGPGGNGHGQGSSTSSTGKSFGGGAPFVPGTQPVPPCHQSHVDETGVTDSQIQIGQLITDSQNLPEQFGPAYAGLSAYVRLVNQRGGVCGRQLVIDEENDNGNPQNHDFAAMAQRDFAFVGNESLFDGLDYNSDFSPKYRDPDTGGCIPDAGGLAFSYNRSQSQCHAGVIGSVSPVLVGGGQFKYYISQAAKTSNPCRDAGVLYVVEPTGASQDQAELGKAALESSWGGGPRTVHEYSASLAAPTPVYRGIVENMIRDNVNCVFSYVDLNSDISFENALYEEGVWPPGQCNRAIKSQCFSVVWVAFSAYDARLVSQAEGTGHAAAQDIVTFIPHLPLGETSNPAMRTFVSALAACRAANYEGCTSTNAVPSTFSLLGYASGILFVQALQQCGGAPTRGCVMQHLHVQGFTGGGLLGANTPFRCTSATYNGTHYCWKWIFYSSVSVKVAGSTGTLSDFKRIYPSGGFFSDTLHVARGTAG